MNISNAAVKSLDDFAKNTNEFDVFGGKGLESFLLTKAAKLAVIANGYLEAADRNSSGRLADSIAPREPKRIGNAVVVDVQLAFYYKFIDQGVNGYKRNRGSAYNYKPTMPSPDMRAALKEWLIKEGKKQRNNPYKPISARETRRSKTPKKDLTIDERAFVAALAVKKMGQKRTLFWQKSIADIETDIEKTIGEQLNVIISRGLVR